MYNAVRNPGIRSKFAPTIGVNVSNQLAQTRRDVDEIDVFTTPVPIFDWSYQADPLALSNSLFNTSDLDGNLLMGSTTDSYAMPLRIKREAQYLPSGLQMQASGYTHLPQYDLHDDGRGTLGVDPAINEPIRFQVLHGEPDTILFSMPSLLTLCNATHPIYETMFHGMKTAQGFSKRFKDHGGLGTRLGQLHYACIMLYTFNNTVYTDPSMIVDKFSHQHLFNWINRYIRNYDAKYGTSTFPTMYHKVIAPLEKTLNYQDTVVSDSVYSTITQGIKQLIRNKKFNRLDAYVTLLLLPNCYENSPFFDTLKEITFLLFNFARTPPVKLDYSKYVKRGHFTKMIGPNHTTMYDKYGHSQSISPGDVTIVNRELKEVENIIPLAFVPKSKKMKPQGVDPVQKQLAAKLMEEVLYETPAGRKTQMSKRALLGDELKKEIRLRVTSYLQAQNRQKVLETFKVNDAHTVSEKQYLESALEKLFTNKVQEAKEGTQIQKTAENKALLNEELETKVPQSQDPSQLVQFYFKVLESDLREAKASFKALYHKELHKENLGYKFFANPLLFNIDMTLRYPNATKYSYDAIINGFMQPLHHELLRMHNENMTNLITFMSQNEEASTIFKTIIREAALVDRNGNLLKLDDEMDLDEGMVNIITKLPDLNEDLLIEMLSHISNQFDNPPDTLLRAMQEDVVDEDKDEGEGYLFGGDDDDEDARAKLINLISTKIPNNVDFQEMIDIVNTFYNDVEARIQEEVDKVNANAREEFEMEFQNRYENTMVNMIRDTENQLLITHEQAADDFTETLNVMSTENLHLKERLDVLEDEDEFKAERIESLEGALQNTTVALQETNNEIDNIESELNSIAKLFSIFVPDKKSRNSKAMDEDEVKTDPMDLETSEGKTKRQYDKTIKQVRDYVETVKNKTAEQEALIRELQTSLKSQSKYSDQERKGLEQQIEKLQKQLEQPDPEIDRLRKALAIMKEEAGEYYTNQLIQRDQAFEEYKQRNAEMLSNMEQKIRNEMMQEAIEQFRIQSDEDAKQYYQASKEYYQEASRQAQTQSELQNRIATLLQSISQSQGVLPEAMQGPLTEYSKHIEQLGGLLQNSQTQNVQELKNIGALMKNFTTAFEEQTIGEYISESLTMPNYDLFQLAHMVNLNSDDQSPATMNFLNNISNLVSTYRPFFEKWNMYAYGITIEQARALSKMLAAAVPKSTQFEPPSAELSFSVARMLEAVQSQETRSLSFNNNDEKQVDESDMQLTEAPQRMLTDEVFGNKPESMKEYASKAIMTMIDVYRYYADALLEATNVEGSAVEYDVFGTIYAESIGQMSNLESVVNNTFQRGFLKNMPLMLKLPDIVDASQIQDIYITLNKYSEGILRAPKSNIGQILFEDPVTGRKRVLARHGQLGRNALELYRSAGDGLNALPPSETLVARTLGIDRGPVSKKRQKRDAAPPIQYRV